jgi:hypothetical protein
MPPPDDLHEVEITAFGGPQGFIQYRPRAVYTLEAEPRVRDTLKASLRGAPPQPQSMDTLEFLDWLDTASVDELERFASTSYLQ